MAQPDGPLKAAAGPSCAPTGQEVIGRAFSRILIVTGSCIVTVAFGILINSPSAALLGLAGSLLAHAYGSWALRCPFCRRSLYRQLVSARRLLTSWRAWSVDTIASCPQCEADLTTPVVENTSAR